jgi:hypothetical protein
MPLPSHQNKEAAAAASPLQEDDSGLKQGVDPDVGEYQIDLDQPDSFTLGDDLDEDHFQRYKQKLGRAYAMGDEDEDEENEELDDIYNDGEDEYGEEAEEI